MSEEPKRESKLPGFKVVVGTVGAVFAVAHIGLLGYVVRRPEPPRVPQVPTINIPSGDYSSYKLKATKDGYEIEYKANDPAILESSKSLTLDKEKKGLFTEELRAELSSVVISSLWMALVISEVTSQTPRESRMQKAQSVSRRTLVHAVKVQWQVVLIAMVLQSLQCLVSPTLVG